MNRITEITKKGHELLAKVLAKKCELHFTRAVAGDGIAADTWDVESLVSPKLVGRMVEVTAKPKERCTQITAVFSNETVASFFQMNELGVFALDPDEGEILYCYGLAGERANFIEEFVGGQYNEEIIDVFVYTANTANITANIVKTEWAKELKYDNSRSGLSADNVQDSIDEVDQNVDVLSDKFYRQAMCGNVQNYIDWAKEYPHIGDVRVQPLYFGANTVRVLITDDTGAPAPKTLVDCFQFYLDPNRSGFGNGVAPIGAHVTVAPGTACPINITANIQLADGYSQPEGARKAMEHYLENMAGVNGSINYNDMRTAIQRVPSIAAISNFLLNGNTISIDLAENDIPVINEMSLVVI